MGDLKVKKRRFESCRPNTITVEEMGVLTRDSPIVKQSSDKLATQAPNPSITDVKGQSPTIIETDGGEPGTPTHNGLRKSKQVLDTEFAHQHEERTDSPLFVGGEQNFGARSRRKRLLKKPSYLSVAGIQKSQLKMTAEGRSAPFGAAADDLPVGHKLLTESISMPSSQPQQAVKKSHDYRSATFMAAADESLEPSRNASSKVSVNDYSQIPAVLPVTISTPNPPLQPGIANQQSDHTEETRSAPLAAAADNPSNFTSPGETQKCMDHNHGDHKVPPSTDPVSSTTSQTATTPPISLLGGPSNQCRKVSSFTLLTSFSS